MADPGRAAARAEFSFAERVAACDVCGAAAFSSVDAEANVVSCDACGYRFVNPRPSQSEIAAAYSDPHFYDGWIADDTGRHEMWRKRLALVRQHTQRPGPDLRPDSRQGSRAGLAHGTRLLDVGAGIGAFLAMAREQGWTVAGTEVSTSARNLARERYGLDLLFGQAEDLPLPSQAFDVVTLWHVLEHVPSPARLLRACAQALVPGGFLVVAVPNDDDAAFFPNRVKRSILGALGRHPAPRVHRSRRGRKGGMEESERQWEVEEQALLKVLDHAVECLQGGEIRLAEGDVDVGTSASGLDRRSTSATSPCRSCDACSRRPASMFDGSASTITTRCPMSRRTSRWRSTGRSAG